MKIAIIGTGAMGSVYAAYFASAGNEVWAVDTWQAHVDAMRTTGLRLDGPTGSQTVAGIHATTDIAEARDADLFVLATKASAVGDAARAIAPLIRPDAMVLTIQNGLGAGDRIAEHMPTQNVLIGVADGFGAAMKGPGHAHHNAMKLIRLGEMAGGITPRLEALEKTWQDAGFNVKSFPDINQLIWEKFLCNVTFSAPCTVFDCTVGELMASEQSWELALSCTREAYAAGQAEGIDFSFNDPIAYVTAFGTSMPAARPSMLLDHHAGRASEIGAINGMVPIVAAGHGLDAPVNGTLAKVVRAREALFRKAST